MKKLPNDVLDAMESIEAHTVTKLVRQQPPNSDYDLRFIRKAGMKAALDALETKGYAVVPREPTVGMAVAGADLLSENSRFGHSEFVVKIFRAMLAAAESASDE